MDKFSYGNYDSSNTDIAFDSSKGYTEPSGETDVRKELSYPLKELKEYINDIVPVDGDDTAIQLRISDEGLVQYSYDGSTWNDTASGGHNIFDDNDNQMPQKTKLMFKNTTVYNSGDYTVVEGLQGVQGVSVASMVQTETSSVSSGQNTWTATLSNGNTYDFAVLNGEQGEKGDPGTAVLIKGAVNAVEDLPSSGMQEGDIWIVGTSDSNPAYVWSSEDNAWENIGKIRGEKGATGNTGAQGVGIQSIVETPSLADGGTNVWTITLTNGTTYNFNVLNGNTGSAGTGMPAGGSAGQLLAKKTGVDYDLEWVTLSAYMALVSGATNGDVATLNSSGQVVDSGTSLTTLTGKMDKASGATADDVATLNASGQVVDSGVAISTLTGKQNAVLYGTTQPTSGQGEDGDVYILYS